MKFTILALLLLVGAGAAAGQQLPGRFSNFDELLESVAGETEEGEEYGAWLEDLHEKYDRPVDINSAGREELLAIPFITEPAVEAILTCRQKFGPFLSPYELASLPAIGREMAEKISFFIKAGSPPEPRESDTLFRKRGYHDIIMKGGRTFPQAAGFRSRNGKPPLYPGSQEMISARYRYEKQDLLKVGLTADKDPGEPFFTTPNRRGFDHYSGYVSFRVSDRIPRVIIGDFTAGTGQGALLWQGFTMPGSADIMQTSKNASYVKPHSSTAENRYFRGAAASFRWGDHRCHLLISRMKGDGHLEMGADSVWKVTSLPVSGYHRTPSEIAGKKSVRQTAAALFYQVAKPGLKAGVTVMALAYSHPLDPGEELYEKYYFRGNRLLNTGIDYRWIRGYLQMYGEGAISWPGGLAVVQGLEARLHDQLALALSFRHFGKEYHAPLAGAFSAGSRCAGETGLYAALRLLPAAGMTLTASIDWHHAPWILYTTAAPSSGSLITLRADIHPSPRLSGYLRFRAKSSAIKTNTTPLLRQENLRQENLRLQADYAVTPALTLRWRTEVSRRISTPPEKGILISHDIAWKPLQFPLSATFRAAWFHTDTYASGIYAYENDLLYSFSSVNYYGHGCRTYLNLKTTLTHGVDAWVKLGNTTWFDRDKTGSGADEREGKSKRELKIQLRYHF